MTPAARIAAVIEILEELDASTKPSDQVVTAYLRARRFIGSKDRRSIADRLYGLLRATARISWWCRRAGLDPESARHRLLAGLALIDGSTLEQVDTLFDGRAYHPGPLSPVEKAALAALQAQTLDHSEQARDVRLECPGWMLPAFDSAFGPMVEKELRALLTEAPLDLRVNSLKADRAEAAQSLLVDGIETEPTPLSPQGLQVVGRRAVQSSRAFQDGLVEIQDEGSQLLALLTDARPGQVIADLCAGAGGKTLALGAVMKGEGRLIALDRDVRRLERARPRLRRAGLAEVELRPLAGPNDPWLMQSSDSFDRVLIDAPCSGTGTWRRNPAARWRLTPELLAKLRSEQDSLLETGGALVKPGGRLVYATCSLLREENEDRITTFLDRHEGFSVIPADEIWQTVLGGGYPGDGPFLCLSPARQGCDGFFVAILERLRTLEV